MFPYKVFHRKEQMRSCHMRLSHWLPFKAVLGATIVLKKAFS